MRLFSVAAFLYYCINVITSFVASSNITQRYEYLFSFKPPLLAQSNGEIPFFEHGGQSIASADSLRLTPSMVNKQGWVWSKKVAEFPGFDVSFSFRVTGKGRIGADGLAFWYVKEKSAGGQMFGAANIWDGLAVVFDTYDNDNENNNPIVIGFVNNGTQKYNHDADGLGQQSGQCIRDFRNRPYPIRANVHYFDQTITVAVSYGMSEKEEPVTCFVINNVVLPPKGYFGLSAATGDLADDHDVYRLEVQSLRHEEQANTSVNAERAKIEEEYEKYAEQLKIAQEEYEKQQAEVNKKKKLTDEEVLENENNRHLRQIWESHSSLFLKLNELTGKLDEIKNQLQSASAAAASSSSSSSQPAVDNSHQIAQVGNQIHELSVSVNEIKSVALEKLTKIEQISLKNGNQDNLQYVRKSLTELDSVVRETANHAKSFSSCPSCMSYEFFLLIITLQTIILIGLFLFYHKQEVSVKKFY